MDLVVQGLQDIDRYVISLIGLFCRHFLRYQPIIPFIPLVTVASQTCVTPPPPPPIQSLPFNLGLLKEIYT